MHVAYGPEYWAAWMMDDEGERGEVIREVAFWHLSPVLKLAVQCKDHAGLVSGGCCWRKLLASSGTAPGQAAPAMAASACALMVVHNLAHNADDDIHQA